MPSPARPQDKDDDEFDWEAAVQEIDNACNLASIPNSTSNTHGFVTPVMMSDPATLCPRGGKGRQSTLDRFVAGSHMTKRSRNCLEARSGPSGHAERELNVVGADDLVSVKIDLEAAKTWIYPLNVPLRDYQSSIARTALFSNTLVVLPTGLGKTLIAAVVMYNYFRWFPEGKIVFAAPSRPLVMQQIEACHNIVGIPQEWTIDMTGQMCPAKRSTFWKTKRVFFVTPQVLEKDIQSGICLVKQLVCFVVDEAHRATGNYSYCVAVREIMATPVQLRILALTATPGSKQRTIQNVIDNLHISTMEYRNEGDHDVSQYVHNRKLELIQVAMSECASALNNLLSEAKRPYVARLCALGVLQHRDAATWSPCQLLDLRDKFRQAPPSNLHHKNYGEVEGYFGVLITLYHIQKLLSSHGIKPAYDLLEEKLKQGFFARIMSKNENIIRATLTMQQSLAHGAPNPKLVKMTEILLDHFRKNDPKESRVIIFSNFRGSVKHIMDSLSRIGDHVKATEFVGQSTAKTLKGQSQKVQQAVLQKFRSGGFNVIVATSIGEEGLDIMEVDLVICFDSNVSPLRMIQRMGRTGRKHDGRVVVLAFEGSEVKGYLQKQTSGKAVRKHMQNGGINSFNFHASPRMVPHVCKPEVHFVELSVEQFIPRGKKTKEDASNQSPILNNISKEENNLIARYFGQSKMDSWIPSLIAFPSFQSFPSRVHTVNHSTKTTMMLIDTMQRLEELSFSKAKMDLVIEGATSSRFIAGTITSQSIVKQDSMEDCNVLINYPKNLVHERTTDVEATNCETDMLDATVLTPPGHTLLFGGDFVTVNSFGSVCILNVPAFPLVGSAISELIRTVREKEFSVEEKTEHVPKVASSFHAALPPENALELPELAMCIDNPINPRLHSPNDGAEQENDRMKFVFQSPVDQDKAPDTLAVQEYNSLLMGKSSTLLSTRKMSPRLTDFVEEGIVPESQTPCSFLGLNQRLHSPNDGAEQENDKMKSVFQSPVDEDKVADTLAVKEHNSLLMGKSSSLLSPRKLSPRLADFIEKGIVPESPIPSSNAINMVLACTTEGDPAMTQQKKVWTDMASSSSMLLKDVLEQNSLALSPNSPKVTKILRETKLCSTSSSGIDCERKQSDFPLIPEQSPPFNSVTNSSKENWQLSSGSKLVKQAPKYRRLCKYGDKMKQLSCQNLTEKYENCIHQKIKPSSTKLLQIDCHQGIKKKTRKYLNNFIEEEAAVSVDEVSEDEEDGEHDDKYEGSFIDDQTNPTEENSLTENEESDMLAFYRRSLLTQSPLGALPLVDSVSSRTTESGSHSSERIVSSLQTPQNDTQPLIPSCGGYSVACRVDSKQNNLVTIYENGSSTQIETSSRLESRKRKLSFNNACSTPARDFRCNNTVHSEQSPKDMNPGIGSRQAYNSLFCDDEFYQSLDLDAVEAQATELLRFTSRLPIGKTPPAVIDVPSEINQDPHIDQFSYPSFDLGL